MQNEENSGKDVRIDLNSGQFNHKSQVTNQYLAKVSEPLREGVELRDCPGCYTQSVVDAEICRNDNCNTNFKHYCNRMAVKYLEAEIRGLERRLWTSLPWFAGGGIIGLLFIAFDLWMIGAPLLFVLGITFAMFQNQDIARERELQAGVNLLKLELW